MVMARERKRRDKGSGSQRWIKDRRQWRVVKTVNGRKLYAYADKLTDAWQKLDRQAFGVISGSFGELSSSSRVDELAEHYIAQRANDGKLSSRQHSERILRTYVIPHIGRLKLDKVTSADVSGMMRTLSLKGGRNGAKLSPQTVKHAKKETSAIFDWAVKRDLMKRNPASDDFVKVPRVEKTVRAMTQEQWLEVRKHSEHEPLRVLIETAVKMGLRRGELLAMTWDDLKLDSKRPTLTVRRTIQRISGHGLVLTAPKTKLSRRTLDLHPALVKDLIAHRKTQDEKRRTLSASGMKWGQMFPKERWVFTNSIGNPIEGNYFGKQLNRITNEAGIGSWSPHELRHTCASFAIASGVQLKELSEFLGHSSIKETADTYAFLYPASRIETTAKIGDFADGKSFDQR